MANLKRMVQQWLGNPQWVIHERPGGGWCVTDFGFNDILTNISAWRQENPQDRNIFPA